MEQAKMEIKIEELNDTYVRFLLSGASPETANALRRVLLTEVPKMAIDKVEFHLGALHNPKDPEGKECESSSPLFDEIVAHRLGMVPIPTDLDIFVEPDKCVCKGEGCMNCQIVYKLECYGPVEVFSGDLESLGDPSLAVKDKLIPITRLGEGQGALIYAYAELGTAKKHAKWQGTSGVSYRHVPKVKIDPAKCDNGGTCIGVCPKDVFKSSEEGKVFVADERACILCNQCVKVCNANREVNGKRKPPAISIDKDESRFIFEFETDGSLTAKKTLLVALDILEKKFDAFREQVSSLEA
jgi:DNA-directed RNA polymerase subunit D